MPTVHYLDQIQSKLEGKESPVLADIQLLCLQAKTLHRLSTMFIVPIDRWSKDYDLTPGSIECNIHCIYQLPNRDKKVNFTVPSDHIFSNDPVLKTLTGDGTESKESKTLVDWMRPSFQLCAQAIVLARNDNTAPPLYTAWKVFLDLLNEFWRVKKICGEEKVTTKGDKEVHYNGLPLDQLKFILCPKHKQLIPEGFPALEQPGEKIQDGQHIVNVAEFADLFSAWTKSILFKDKKERINVALRSNITNIVTKYRHAKYERNVWVKKMVEEIEKNMVLPERFRLY